MNPRMAIDYIACARMPTAAWSMPVSVQNRIMRSCALSLVGIGTLPQPTSVHGSREWPLRASFETEVHALQIAKIGGRRMPVDNLNSAHSRLRREMRAL